MNILTVGAIPKGYILCLVTLLTMLILTVGTPTTYNLYD